MNDLIYIRTLRSYLVSNFSLVVSLGYTHQTLAYRDKRNTQVIEEVLKGNSLGTTLRTHPLFKRSMTPFLIELGERTGTLIEILGHIDTYLTMRYELSKRIRSLLFMPLITGVVFSAVSLVILMVVFPQLTALTQDLSSQTTMPTFSTTIPYYALGIGLISLMAICALIGKIFENYTRGIYQVLIFKYILTSSTYYAFVFCSTLSLLLCAHHSLVVSLEILQKRFPIFTHFIAVLKEDLYNGMPFNRALEKHWPFHQRLKPLIMPSITQGTMNATLGESSSRCAQNLFETLTQKLSLYAKLAPLVIMGLLGLGTALILMKFYLFLGSMNTISI